MRALGPWIGIIIFVAVFAGVMIYVNVTGYEGPIEKSLKEDEIVVTCAEAILNDFAKSDRTIIDSLAHDDIFLGWDEHPFNARSNYLRYKADYYRNMFKWGRLPPQDIMGKVGIR